MSKKGEWDKDRAVKQCCNQVKGSREDIWYGTWWISWKSRGSQWEYDGRKWLDDQLFKSLKNGFPGKRAVQERPVNIFY